MSNEWVVKLHTSGRKSACGVAIAPRRRGVFWWAVVQSASKPIRTEFHERTADTIPKKVQDSIVSLCQAMFIAEKNRVALPVTFTGPSGLGGPHDEVTCSPLSE